MLYLLIFWPKAAVFYLNEDPLLLVTLCGVPILMLIIFYIKTNLFYFMEQVQSILSLDSLLVPLLMVICVKQAIMYLLCFRMRSMMDDPQSKSLLAGLPLESILRTEISPLKVRTASKYNLKICTSIM